MKIKKNKSKVKKAAADFPMFRIVALILMIIVIIFAVVMISNSGIISKIRGLPDFKRGELNSEELANDGCDVIVGEINSKNSYISVKDINNGEMKGTFLMWKSGQIIFDKGFGSYHFGSNEVVGVVDLKYLTINIISGFLDKDSYEFKNSGLDGFLDINDLIELNGAFQLEDSKYLCKTKSQVEEIKNRNNCQLKCSELDGECVKRISLNDFKNKWESYYSSDNDGKIYSNQNGKGNELTNYYLELDNGRLYIKDKTAWFSKNVGEIIQNGKYTGLVFIYESTSKESSSFLSGIDRTYYDKDDKKFKMYDWIKEMSGCSNDKISFGSVNCGENYECCASSSREKLNDNGLSIDKLSFRVGNKENIIVNDKLKVNYGESENINFIIKNFDKNKVNQFFCYNLMTNKRNIVADSSRADKGIVERNINSIFSDDSVFEIFAKDNINNKTVFKRFKLDNSKKYLDGTAIDYRKFFFELISQLKGYSVYMNTPLVNMKFGNNNIAINFFKANIKDDKIFIYAFYQVPGENKPDWQLLNCHGGLFNKYLDYSGLFRSGKGAENLELDFISFLIKNNCEL